MYLLGLGPCGQWNKKGDLYHSGDGVGSWEGTKGRKLHWESLGTIVSLRQWNRAGLEHLSLERVAEDGLGWASSRPRESAWVLLKKDL